MKLLVALLLLCAAALPSASAANDIFIRAKGNNPAQLAYTGDSNVQQFPASEGWFQLASVSIGLEAESSLMNGTGASVGKPMPRPLSMVKFPNSASAAFFNACTQGRGWDEFEIVFTTPSNDKLEVTLRIEVKKCFVTDLSLGGSDGDDRPTESVKLVYGAQRYTFFAPNPQTGKYIQAGQSTWSFTRGTPTFD